MAEGTHPISGTPVGTQTPPVEALFAEFLARRMRGDPVEPQEILGRAGDEAERSELARLLGNFLQRVEPRPGAEVPPARRLGSLQVLAEIGRGGMGVVYLAFDEALKRKVAVKVLPSSSAQGFNAIERFHREAEAAARLRHRNIIPIYASGEAEGTYYYSMEYVPGITLGELIRALRAHRFAPRGALTLLRVQEQGEQVLKLLHEARPEPGPGGRIEGEAPGGGIRVLSLPLRNYVREAVRFFAEVADALDYAHKQGVVHRDIKPSNLILAPDGRLLLADFGLAKVGGEGSITGTGDLMGSPAYMSPEQVVGRRVPVDHRTDLWSIGVTFYEFLTLAHPFPASSLQAMFRNVVALEPRPPRRVNPRLPKDVETILLKTLEKNPDRRYAGAADLAGDLRRFLDGEAILAKSAGRLTRTLRFARQHRTWMALGALGGALLLVGAWAFLAVRSEKRRSLEERFAVVRENALRQGDGLLGEADVATIQGDLLRSLKGSEDPAAAIDQAAMKRILLATDRLRRPGPRGGEGLTEAMRSLAQVRLVYQHLPDRRDRVRVERIDRASADLRVRLAWAIHDACVASNRVPSPLRWEWLCSLLGTRPSALGIREQNPLVRVNAIEAMRSLDAGRLTYEIESLLDREPRLDPRVQRFAVRALAQAPRRAEGPDPHEILARHLLRDPRRFPPSDFLVRYEAAKALLGSEDRARFREVFRLLLGDDEPAVRAIAERGLR